jgi:carboxylesterase
VAKALDNSTASFHFVPSGPQLGHVLLFHGFSGSPWELRPLGESLQARGYAASAPLLPGHGRMPEDLLFVDWFTWLRFAEVSLLKQQKPVVLGGLSMGALLSLILAARYPALVKGLVLLAPVVQISGLGRVLHALRSFDLKGLAPEWVSKEFPDVEHEAVKKSAPCLPRYPLRRVLDLMTLQDMAREVEDRVECPSLIVAAVHDHVVPFSGVEAFHKRLARSRFVPLKKGCHIIPRDNDRALALTEVAAFLEQVFAR